MSRQNNDERVLSPYEQLKELITNTAMMRSFGKALGNSMPVDPWVQSALALIYRDKKLQKARKDSVIFVLMQAATMGLRFEDALGQAYLSPLEKWTYDDVAQKTVFSHVEAQLTVGYRGLIDIAYRDPAVREVKPSIVHQNDDFEFYYGSRPFLDHRWDPRMTEADRGKMVAVYSGLRYKDDFYSFEVYPIGDVFAQRDKTLEEKNIIVRYTDDGEEIFFKRDRRAKGGYKEELGIIGEGDDVKYFLEQTNGKGRLFPMSFSDVQYLPWIKYPIPMIKKTAIRWAAKYWPMSHEFNSAAYFAETEEAGISQEIEEHVKALVPDEIRRQVEAALPSAGNKTLSKSQPISMETMGALSGQMAREAGVIKDDEQPKNDAAQSDDDNEERRKLSNLKKKTAGKRKTAKDKA